MTDQGPMTLFLLGHAGDAAIVASFTEQLEAEGQPYKITHPDVLGPEHPLLDLERWAWDAVHETCKRHAIDVRQLVIVAHGRGGLAVSLVRERLGDAQVLYLAPALKVRWAVRVLATHRVRVARVAHRLPGRLLRALARLAHSCACRCGRATHRRVWMSRWNDAKEAGRAELDLGWIGYLDANPVLVLREPDAVVWNGCDPVARQVPATGPGRVCVIRHASHLPGLEAVSILLEGALKRAR